MSSPLQEVWDASASSPFNPAVPKERQRLVAFSLLLLGLLLTGIFALNRSLVNLPLLGIPASIAFGFGAVYLICAVGVNV